MIRILHVVHSMNRGGAETFIMNVYRQIDREKIQFDFLVHEEKEGAYDKEIIELGGKIYYITPRNKGIVANKKSLDEFFKNNTNYKIVHAHCSSLSYIDPLKYAKKYGVPIRIIHSHNTRASGHFIHKYIHKFNKLFISRIATEYFACSDLASEWMFGKNIVKKEKYKFINNGIDTEKFKYDELKRYKIRNEFNINDKFVLGHIGRFTYQKNHEFLLNVFNLINKKYPNTILMLVGDGELRSQIEDKITKLELSEKVILTGIRSDIPELMQAMDMFLFPSYYEGLPVTLIEAQASGLNCIVSDKITKQVSITNNINYIGIERESEWLNLFIKLKNKKRDNEIEKIKDSGFDVKSVTEYLEKIYIKGYKLNEQ